MKNYKLDNQIMATFTRQLSLVLDSDLPIHQGLEIIESKTKSEGLKHIIKAVRADIKEGYSLSESLLKFSDEFTPFVVNMIELGEKSGSLNNVLTQIADSLEKEIEIKSKVKSALAYPIILSLMMLGVIMLLVVKVLPAFDDILKSLGGELPGFTAWMLESSKFIGGNLLTLVALVVIVVIGFFLFKNTKKGRFTTDKWVFFIPVQKGIASAVMGSRFARNLSVLLKSGFSFTIALEMLKPIMDNEYMNLLIDNAVVELKEGVSIAEVVEKFNIFPGIMIRLFSVAEKTGHMDQMLDKVSVEMEKEADMKLEGIATVIEPLLIIILSILIGVILVSVILPIINILNSIG